MSGSHITQPRDRRSKRFREMHYALLREVNARRLWWLLDTWR